MLILQEFLKINFKKIIQIIVNFHLFCYNSLMLEILNKEYGYGTSDTDR